MRETDMELYWVLANKLGVECFLNLVFISSAGDIVLLTKLQDSQLKLLLINLMICILFRALQQLLTFGITL